VGGRRVADLGQPPDPAQDRSSAGRPALVLPRPAGWNGWDRV